MAIGQATKLVAISVPLPQAEIHDSRTHTEKGLRGLPSGLLAGLLGNSVACASGVVPRLAGSHRERQEGVLQNAGFELAGVALRLRRMPRGPLLTCHEERTANDRKHALAMPRGPAQVGCST